MMLPVPRAHTSGKRRAAGVLNILNTSLSCRGTEEESKAVECWNQGRRSSYKYVVRRMISPQAKGKAGR